MTDPISRRHKAILETARQTGRVTVDETVPSGDCWVPASILAFRAPIAVACVWSSVWSRVWARASVSCTFVTTRWTSGSAWVRWTVRDSTSPPAGGAGGGPPATAAPATITGPAWPGSGSPPGMAGPRGGVTGGCCARSAFTRSVRTSAAPSRKP